MEPRYLGCYARRRFLRTAISSLIRRRAFGGFVFERTKISFFATCHKTFRHGFQFFPPRADLFGLRLGDLAVDGGGGDDGEQVGEFLDDLVGRGGRGEQVWGRRWGWAWNCDD